MRRFDLRLAEAHLDGAPTRAAPRGWQTLPQPTALQQLTPEQREHLSEAVTELAVLRHLAAEARSPSASSHSLLSKVAPRHVHLPLLQQAARCRRLCDAPLPDNGSEFESHLCGILASARGDRQKSIEFFRRCLQQSKQRRRFWTLFSLARCLQKSGELAEAVALYGECIGQRPELAWPHYNLALAYVAMGQPAAAKRRFEESLRLAPGLAQAHLDLGALQFREGNFRKALASCQRAIDGGLESSQAYVNRAAALAATGNRTAARKDLQRALQLNPHDQTALDNLKQLNAQWH